MTHCLTIITCCDVTIAKVYHFISKAKHISISLSYHGRYICVCYKKLDSLPVADSNVSRNYFRCFDVIFANTQKEILKMATLVARSSYYQLITLNNAKVQLWGNKADIASL